MSLLCILLKVIIKLLKEIHNDDYYFMKSYSKILHLLNFLCQPKNYLQKSSLSLLICDLTIYQYSQNLYSVNNLK